MILELLCGRADPNLCSCDSEIGVPSLCYFGEVKQEGDGMGRPGLVGVARGRAMGQGWAEDFRPWREGRGLPGERSEREAGDTGGWGPLLLTVVKGQQNFPKFIHTSALNPSNSFILIPWSLSIFALCPKN